MPKIIKDVEQSVFKAVMDVVTSEGIDQLSMKQRDRRRDSLQLLP